MGASSKTVAIDVAGPSTVQSNAWRKHINVRWFEDVCVLSVNDGEQQSEQNDGDRNLCDDWNEETENWVQNGMMNGQKNENRVQNEMMNGHKTENWVQKQMMNDHKIETWAQNNLTDCHKN